MDHINSAIPSNAAYLLAMYGAIDGNSSAQNLLQLPLGVQEMVLAVWMIARGFRPVVSNTSVFQERPTGESPIIGT